MAVFPHSIKRYHYEVRDERLNMPIGALYGFALTDEEKKDRASFRCYGFTFLLFEGQERREFIFEVGQKDINKMIIFYSHPEDDREEVEKALRFLMGGTRAGEDSWITKGLDIAIKKYFAETNGIDLDLLSAMLD